jgi:apolipoprotein N-acyltransferase
MASPHLVDAHVRTPSGAGRSPTGPTPAGPTPTGPTPTGPTPAGLTEGGRKAALARFTIAVIASAALLFLGTGLAPHPWLTWWFPLPLLILAPQVRARVVLAGGLLAGTLGGANLWRYATATLGLPIGTVAGFVVGEGVLLAAMVTFFAYLVPRDHLVCAALCPPALWVVGEWLTARFSPNGAFLSLAYSQVGTRPLLAVTSLTGVWGLSYLVLVVPTACAALVMAPNRRGSAAVLGAVAALVGVTLGYGLWFDRNAQDAASPSVDVAAVVINQPYDPVPLATPGGRRLVSAYVGTVSRLASDGAQLVVLPEKAFSATVASEPALVSAFRGIAARNRVTVVVGLVHDDRPTSTAVTNVALGFPPSGARPTRYTKQHLIPSYESDFTAGDTVVTMPVDGGELGLAICKDLDFPTLSRAYARAGAGVLAVPAWDFGVDGWLHSRIALTRGVESGMAVVRTARDGALTATDRTGRVLAESRTTNGPSTQIRTRVRLGSHDTLYDSWGDWFAYACVVFVGLGLVRALRVRQAR